MNGVLGWAAALVTLALVGGYEVRLALALRRRPGAMARTAHARLRQDWFAAVSEQRGSEILAVQTLRNSLMSATMTASTATLALMGTLTLGAPSLRASVEAGAAGSAPCSPRLFMELVVLALLMASLVASAMAVRYYNHASFVGGMPVDSPSRRHWNPTGSVYARKAGLLYGWGLRQLVLVVPAVSFALHPAAGIVTALVVVMALSAFDRTEPGEAVRSQPTSGPAAA